MNLVINKQSSHSTSFIGLLLLFPQQLNAPTIVSNVKLNLSIIYKNGEHVISPIVLY